MYLFPLTNIYIPSQFSQNKYTSSSVISILSFPFLQCCNACHCFFLFTDNCCITKIDISCKYRVATLGAIQSTEKFSPEIEADELEAH